MEYLIESATETMEQRLDKALEKTINILLGEKKFSSLRDILITINPNDIAALFCRLDHEKLPLLFRLLPKELAAETFVEMDDEAQELLIRGFSDSELKEVVDELYVDDAVDLIEEMPANVVQRILAQADPDMRTLINEILNYPEDSAGSIMTTEYVSFQANLTVQEAITRIRRTGIDKETIYTCYVLDDNRRLIGLVSVRTLLLSDESAVISDIMETNIIYVSTLEDREDVANKFHKYDFIALPVVDDELRMVGIVTFDDAIDVMQEEMTEDMQRMGGLTPSDKPFLRTSAFEIWKHRIPWLLLLMISTIFTCMIISSYETALSNVVVLVAFIPMLMGTGGNAGSQASVSAITALSAREISFKDIFKVIFKEAQVSFLCGLTLGVAAFVRLFFIDLYNQDLHTRVIVALIVSITLFVDIMFAKIVGCAMPLVAQKIGFDPAVMSAPLITTLVDIMSLILYFQFAQLFLGDVLAG